MVEKNIASPISCQHVPTSKFVAQNSAPKNKCFFSMGSHGVEYKFQVTSKNIFSLSFLCVIQHCPQPSHSSCDLYKSCGLQSHIVYVQAYKLLGRVSEETLVVWVEILCYIPNTGWKFYRAQAPGEKYSFLQ